MLLRPRDMSTNTDLTSPEGGAVGAPEGELRRLLQASSQGDAEAFGQVYDLFLNRVFRYILYMIGNWSDAEDMTEETFAKAWQRLGSFRGEEQAFKTWLLRIAHNHVVDRLRQRRGDTTMLSDYGEDIAEPNAKSTQTTAEESLLYEQALRLATRLPAQQKQVILLKFVQGLDNREISAITGQREGAIRVAQMRALQTIRQQLSGEGDQHG